jgi:hypothetical protein
MNHGTPVEPRRGLTPQHQATDFEQRAPSRRMRLDQIAVDRIALIAIE